ncbi:condensation domain-containing protein [Streptomyces sp. NBC_00280]|uniref:condensation domain-containing protein n=1 Tax=Streptomyces sp. NBC_00280 TaxID=2975699 RepID=UPI00325061B7
MNGLLHMQANEVARAPITFGQLSLLRSIQNIDPLAANLPQVWKLPAATTSQQVEEALTVLQERHEALRTRYEDLDSKKPTQIILPPQPVVIAGPPQETEPVQAADSLGREPFDLATEPPWRMTLVAKDGELRWLAICLHHIATDGWSVNQLQREFLTLLSAGALGGEAPTCRSLAEEQWSAAKETRRNSARKHWQKIFDRAPAMVRDKAPESVHGRWGRYGTAEQTDAVHRIARAHQISPPSVVLSAYCRAAAQYDGLDEIMVAVFTNNRSDPRWEKLLTTQDQLIPLVVRAEPGEPFGAFATKVHWELFRSYRHGEHNVDDMLEIAAEHGFTGTVNGCFDGSVSGLFTYFFNYMGEYQKDQLSIPEGLETGTTGRNIGAPLYLQVQEGEALTATLQENSSATGYKRITGVLRLIEEILLAAAHETDSRIE